MVIYRMFIDSVRSILYVTLSQRYYSEIDKLIKTVKQ